MIKLLINKKGLETLQTAHPKTARHILFRDSAQFFRRNESLILSGKDLRGKNFGVEIFSNGRITSKALGEAEDTQKIKTIEAEALIRSVIRCLDVHLDHGIDEN